MRILNDFRMIDVFNIVSILKSIYIIDHVDSLLLHYIRNYLQCLQGQEERKPSLFP